MTKKAQIFDSLIQEFPYGNIRYTDVIRTAFELNYGFGSYTRSNRGYYSGGFTRDGHLVNPGKDGRYLVKDSNGLYYIKSK